MSNIFATMSQIDTRKIVEQKNGFTYLSWAHALRLLKQPVPDAMVTKHKFKQADDTYLPYMVDAHGYAYVQVTILLGKDEPATTEPGDSLGTELPNLWPELCMCFSRSATCGASALEVQFAREFAGSPECHVHADRTKTMRIKISIKFRIERCFTFEC